MVQEGTVLIAADNSGVKELRVFRNLGGSVKKSSSIGDVVVCSAIKVTPNGGVKEGQVVKAVIVRTTYAIRRKDGTHIKFDDNAAVLIKADNTPRGTRVFGPVAREIKEGYPKIVSLAPEVL